MGKVICPKCEKDDQIQKVYSIYTGGSVSATSTYSRTESKTQLATRLSPPKNPIRKYGFGTYFLIWIIFSFVCSLVLRWLLGSFESSGLFIGGLGGGILTWLTIKHDTKKYNDAESELQRKWEKYSELYYCYRDDCVFDPNSGKYVSPEGIDRLL